MSILNKINEIELTEEKSLNHIIKNDQDICCCVCFIEKDYIYNTDTNHILSLVDVEDYFFKSNIIPNELLIKSTCNKHFICISCIKRLVNNYENHPINDTNSHFTCPYPFEDCVTTIGFKNIFDHNLIKKICNEQEWTNYISHAENYAFPGYTIIKCPVLYYKQGERILCNTEILLENEMIKNKSIGDFIVDCTQNADCLKRFCFNCKQTMSYYHTDCFDCKTTYENENPFVFNYYFNKMSQLVDKIDESDTTINYEESSYLYKNNEITEEIALQQILNVIKDTNSYFICPICKISLYKTERCNGLSHHNIERCYACGRIGFKTRGLGEHWNTNGLGGCFRFDHDSYIKQYIPEYKCNETHCSNHDRGDCIIQDHQKGIEKLQETRKYAYVYHMLKSLLVDIRFNVYDTLYDKLKNTSNIKYLPYKQTLMLLCKLKSHNKNYCENVFYESINCIHPKNIQEFSNKNYTIVCDQFLNTYALKIKLNNTNESYYNYIYTITNRNDNDDDNLSIDSSSGLLTNNTLTTDNTMNNTINNVTQITITNDISSHILEEIIFEIDNYIQNSTSVENNNTNTINIEETEIQTHTISNTTNTTNIQIDNDISFNLTNITSQNIIQNTISNNRRFYTSSDNQSSVSTNGYCLLFDSDEDD